MVTKISPAGQLLCSRQCSAWKLEEMILQVQPCLSGTSGVSPPPCLFFVTMTRRFPEVSAPAAAWTAGLRGYCMALLLMPFPLRHFSVPALFKMAQFKHGTIPPGSQGPALPLYWACPLLTWNLFYEAFTLLKK